MVAVLNYAPPRAASRWPGRLWAVIVSAGPGILAVAVSGMLSTLTMWHFQAREGTNVLQRTPNERFYAMWVNGIPIVLVTALLLAIWIHSIRRSPRGDRVAVGIIALVLHSGLWLCAYVWLFINADSAFP